MKKRQWDEENWTAGQEEKKTGRIRAFEPRIKTLIQTNLKKLTPASGSGSILKTHHKVPELFTFRGFPSDRSE